jgi:hypothetical protein
MRQTPVVNNDLKVSWHWTAEPGAAALDNIVYIKVCREIGQAITAIFLSIKC